ncbi:MAG TPA: hypothetical protein PLV92_22500, partial [Pirellulaceae bacterium]|nr:hypothetical protein [Pirellulaceae bacterium]
VAQRWREFDPDEAAACYRLAESYAKLGEARLAWIYRTTPLSAAPDQSATWAQFAGVAQRQGRVVEASRAWSIACETEPTNPDHLMSHADFWLSQNQLARARVLWQKVADGEWQPRFAPTKERAKLLLK